MVTVKVCLELVDNSLRKFYKGGRDKVIGMVDAKKTINVAGVKLAEMLLGREVFRN